MSINQLWHEADREREEKLRSVEPAHSDAYSDRTKIYGEYLAAVNDTGGDTLPLEIHQVALRACTPPSDDIRAHMARLLQEGKLSWNNLTHPYESRFQEIIENIIAAGFNPSIEDYHFIMSQCAAVGHYVGIQKYMHHMGRMGLEFNGQTFGFIFQAIAHRLSFPAPDSERPIIVREFVDVFVQALREMANRRIPPSPMNVDLTFRVLSEVNDSQGVADLLRMNYGMDLSYLDSPPIDAASAPSTSAAISSPNILRFSTSALNSLLETLGRWGQISKMIYVFETLTNPLPVPTKSDNTSDDDDDFSPIQQEWKPHSAEPNTTSFNILIKHCVAHGYPALAKHYAIHLMDMEHKSNRRLWDELLRKPLSEVAAPHVAVNAETLGPIHAFANRTHSVALLRWVIRGCILSIRRKYRAWTYHNATKSKYDPRIAPSTSDAPATPGSSLSSSRNPSRSPTFDVSTHLWILKQDLAALCDLKFKTMNRLYDTIDRIKARLGRRVWDNKDVFFRDEGKRVMVEPEVWKEKVNFEVRKRKVRLRQRSKVYSFNPDLANILLPKSKP